MQPETPFVCHPMCRYGVMFWQQCSNVLLGAKVRKMPYPRLWGILIANIDFFRIFACFFCVFLKSLSIFQFVNPTHKMSTLFAWQKTAFPPLSEAHGGGVLISSTQQLPYGACRKTATGPWMPLDSPMIRFFKSLFEVS